MLAYVAGKGTGLCGACSNSLKLPSHVRWSDLVVAYNMAVRTDRIRGYEQVLCEGAEEDVLHYVDPNELAELFDDPVLPPSVRRAWQEWFRAPR